MDSLDHPAGEGPRPASGVEGGEDLVPDAARLVDGDDGVEVASLAVLGDCQHDQQVGPVAVELGLLVEGGVLPGVLPAVASLLLAAADPVHRAYPVAGVGVADGVVEDLDLAVEEGPGDELALLLALHEVPVGVDEGQLVRRGLGAGDPACEGIATSAARSSAENRGISRLNDRSFDCSANSFTSLRFAAIHRVAAFAKKCEQPDGDSEPPMGRCKPAPGA